MLVTYFAPLMALGVTYIRVGFELWGSQAIGERTTAQVENVKSKRRVSSYIRHMTQNKLNNIKSST